MSTFKDTLSFEDTALPALPQGEEQAGDRAAALDEMQAAYALALAEQIRRLEPGAGEILFTTTRALQADVRARLADAATAAVERIAALGRCSAVTAGTGRSRPLQSGVQSVRDAAGQVGLSWN